MFTANLHDESIVGKLTTAPLQYAFSRKHSAHPGGDHQARPLSGAAAQQALAQALSVSVTDEQSKPRCLYVHIPFCRAHCTYCSFFQYASSPALMDQYVEAMLAEIRWKAQMPWTQAAPFQAVYVGGGTPTDLSATQLHTLVTTLHQAFPLTPDCEITLEGRINRFSDQQFEAALTGGFNRFSFGVQSFDTRVRRSAKRLNDGSEVMERLQHFVAYHSAPIVIDLLFGLPYQNLNCWQRDLQGYLDSGVDGVDLYQLIEMPGLPLARIVEQGKLPAPADTPTKATMFAAGVAFMAQHHQKRLSVNHWASSNRERSIYNSLAKTCAEVLPIGAGAGGNVGGWQLMQSRNIEHYVDAIGNAQFPVMGVTQDTSGLAHLFGAVKSAFDHGVLAQRTLDQCAGFPLYSASETLFSAWQEHGLVNYDQAYLTLTLAGQFWATTLAQNYIRLLQQHMHQPHTVN